MTAGQMLSPQSRSPQSRTFQSVLRSQLQLPSTRITLLQTDLLPSHIFYGAKTLPVSRCQRCFPCVCVCVGGCVCVRVCIAAFVSL